MCISAVPDAGYEDQDRRFALRHPAAFATDAADAPDGGRGDQDVGWRLAVLTQGAMTSHAQARQYLQAARCCIAAARSARRRADDRRYQVHLESARAAHRKARKCLAYVRLCRQRARRLATVGEVAPRSASLISLFGDRHSRS